MEGVEPTCLAAIDPKSIASANFATSAFLMERKDRHLASADKYFFYLKPFNASSLTFGETNKVFFLLKNIERRFVYDGCLSTNCT